MAYILLFSVIAILLFMGFLYIVLTMFTKGIDARYEHTGDRDFTKEELEELSKRMDAYRKHLRKQAYKDNEDIGNGTDIHGSDADREADGKDVPPDIQ